MTGDETYNGWTNHATWVVNLHLSNDKPLYREARERTSDILRNAERCEIKQVVEGIWTVEQAMRFSVADMLKDWCEVMIEDYFDRDARRNQQGGVASDEPQLMIQDLIGGYLADVDWNEIADAWIESVNESTAA